MISEIDNNEPLENIEVNEDIPIEVNQEQSFFLETQSQISDSIEAINSMPDVVPENWESLDQQERLGALQSVENALSEIQNRPSADILSEEMPVNQFGCWDGEVIRINSNHLNGPNEQPVSEMVDTVAHEGRHALQTYALNNPGFLGNDIVEEQWRDNDENYLDVSLVGQQAYQEQPLEADAWEFSSAIRSSIYD